jgi:histone H3/H4
MAHRVVAAIFAAGEAYKRENEALRSILQSLGLSNATIQRRVRAYLKQRKEEETALQLLTRVCEESLKRFPAIDVAATLAETPIGGKLQ